MLIPPFTILVMILFGSLAHWKSLALAHKAMQPVKRAWEMNQESVLINIHELNDLVSRVQQKEETIQQLQSAITEIEQAKTVHITRIDHVATFIEHSDTVNTYYDTPAPATPPRVEECQLVEVPPEAAVHENLVFRKFLDGRPLNIEALYEWTAQHFLPRLGAKYEWFALFRVFSDSKLFESNMEKVSKFAEQMMLWYPGASYPCTASEVNRYKRGHLGQEPYKNWDKNVFRQQMKEQLCNGHPIVVPELGTFKIGVSSEDWSVADVQERYPSFDPETEDIRKYLSAKQVKSAHILFTPCESIKEALRSIKLVTDKTEWEAQMAKEKSNV